MPLCKCCAHPERDELDALLLTPEGSFRNVAQRFGVSLTSVFRHAHTHLPLTIAASRELSAMVSAEHLIARLIELDERADDVYDVARAVGDLRACVLAIREAHSIVESYSRLGALSELEQRLAAAIEQLERQRVGGEGGDRHGDDDAA